MNTQIYNKSGKLSAYGLACGYVEKQETPKGNKKMFVEHNHIHVRFMKGDNTFTLGYMAGREVFEVTELTKARKFYNSIKLN